MIARTLIAVSALVASMSASAAEEATGGWHATAAPPRPGLPVVEVRLGYGGYLPQANAPIALEARAGEQPFDGYIGYRFEDVAGRVADTPVIARAELPPHGQWRFSTYAQVRSRRVRHSLVDRQLVIEWRNRSMDVVATRSVGVPPWAHPSRALRIARPDETVPEAVHRGAPIVVIRAASVSDEPQWYAGFSNIIVPLPLWFELPRRVRQAIFASAVDVVFFGVPERVPQMTAIDRALLPIELQAAPGNVAKPWPYGGGAVPTPVSWMAKEGAAFAGRREMPYVVRHREATFVADEEGLTIGLPSFVKHPFAPMNAWEPRALRPSVRELLREWGPLSAWAGLLLVSVALAIAVRRSARLAAVVTSIVVAVIVIAGRDAIRPAAGTAWSETIEMSAPGMVEREIVRNDYGPMPRRVPETDLALARAGVSRYTGARAFAELRTSGTPPGFGEIFGARVWGESSRAVVRRELDAPLAIRVRSKNNERLLVDYESRFPVHYAAAIWEVNGRGYKGESRLPSPRSGTATIAKDRVVTGAPEPIGFASTPLALTGYTRGRVRTIVPLESLDAPVNGPSTIRGTLTRQPGNRFTGLVMLPRELVRGEVMVVAGPSLGEVSSLTLRSARGEVTVQPRNRYGSGRAALDRSIFDLLDPGGILRITADAAEPDQQIVTVPVTLMFKGESK